MNSDKVIAHLSEQLDWTGPNGQCMGHILLTREEAQWVRNLLKAADTDVVQPDKGG